MYINFEIIKDGLFLGDVELLTAIKQKQTDWLAKHLKEEVLERFKQDGLVDVLQSKKKDSMYWEGLKLTDTGKKFLMNLSFEGVADEESKTLAAWVINEYKGKEGGIVKNKQEVLRRLHWFKTITQIRGNRLAVLIQCAIADTYSQDKGSSFKDYKRDNPRAMLSNMADNLFWSPTSIHDKNKTVDKSPLYNYFESNQEYIEKVWEHRGV